MTAPSGASKEAARARVPAGDRRAVLALARFEGLRLLRHPLVLTAFALCVVWMARPGATTWRSHPPLQDMDRDHQLPLVLVGFAVLIAVNLAATRARRHGTDAILDALVLPPWQRTVAHLLSLLPLWLVGAVMVAAQFGWMATRPEAVGRGDIAELATGPTSVLLLGVVGVLLARLTASAVVAPLTVLALLTSMFVLAAGDSGVAWLYPTVHQSPSGVPTDLLDRPAGWHLLYLLGMTTLLGAVATAVAGGRRRTARGTAVAALTCVLAGALFQSAWPSGALARERQQATERPAEVQRCQRLGTTEYCLFPEFGVWVDDWDRVVREVRALTPKDVAASPITVRQRVNAVDAGSTGSDGAIPFATPSEGPTGSAWSVPVGTLWGSGTEDLALAAATAYRLVTGEAPQPGTPVMCDSRGVLTLWLAVRATSEADLNSLLDGQFSGGGVPISLLGEAQLDAGWVVLREHELAVVQALLDRPRGDVDRRVREEWSALTAPGTSSLRAAELLGVTAPAVTGDDGEWNCR
ncbi:hypothetical protein AQ490_02975 [Wenjunlia vitaminophila]|uniref:Uncharacterized protein n=1 Tax=Wenjunlia vitaminophila TaxID=76728 RepID=A0A0T6LYI1_WENVI|nr:hypothetical protein [Wenjunlia vitaminophila]KRV51166.1 hypothetical protein AQ490_02975 [Wenjunlia vitaminophila]